nr:InlB B-repeat-containing protein [Clostridia bacterium]
MKKIVAILLVACMMLALVPSGVFAAETEADTEAAAVTVAKIGETPFASLADALTAAAAVEKNNVTIELLGDVEWVTGDAHGSTPLIPAESKVGNVTINGNGYTLTATGSGVGSIRAANGSLLTFNDVVVVDESVSYSEGNWELGYLEIAQNLKFVECEFKSAVSYDHDNGQVGAQDVITAEFIDCNFNSNNDNEYAVWVGSGNVSFSGCEFTGSRGIKFHECYGSQLYSAVVDDCTFKDLSKKPGIAIGAIYMNGDTGSYGRDTWDDVSDTSITITNNTFTNVKAGDQGYYIFESDTDVSTFNFTCSNNVAEGIADVTFVTGDGATEVTEQSVAYGNTVVEPTPLKLGYEVIGWFTDEALTVEYNFATVITTEKDFTLYAKWEQTEEDIPETDVTVNIDTVETNAEVKVDGLTPEVEEDLEEVVESVDVAAEDISEYIYNNVEEILSDVTDNADSAEEAAVKALEDAGINVNDDTNVQIVLQPYVDVALTDYKVVDGKAVVKFDITPMVKVVATTVNNTDDIVTENGGKNSVVLGEKKLETEGKEITVTITLPEGFVAEEGDDVYGKHTKDDGKVHLFHIKAKKDNKTGKFYIEFKNKKGFSGFEFARTSYAVATIGQDEYFTLQDAVDEVNENEEILIAEESDENVTVSRAVRFTIKGDFTGEVVAGRGYEVTKRNVAGGVEYEVSVYHAPMVPLFFGTTVRVYDADNGTITPNGIPMIIGGMTKTFKFIPDEGFEVADVIVNGQSIGAVDSYTVDGWQGYITLTAVF